MKVKEIMTTENLRYCLPETTLQEVASIMEESNCGSLPVVDDTMKVIGMITDRDICLSLADTYDKPHPELKVSTIMSTHIQTVNINDHIADVLKKMRVNKIGRLPVLDNQKRLKGILSIHDLLNGSFTGKANLDDVTSSGESLSKTIKALNDRYTSHNGKEKKIMA